MTAAASLASVPIEDRQARLREPFDPSVIGKKPQPYKKDSPKSDCTECGGYHGKPAMHLPFVGHAAVTDRLLRVDPEWTWEPFAVDAQGLPAVDRSGDLWIRLTICGVTRVGVGEGDTNKKRISDGIKNAAMRFGVALDLWSKQALTDPDDETTPSVPVVDPLTEERHALKDRIGKLSEDDKAATRAFCGDNQIPTVTGRMSAEQVAKVNVWLDGRVVDAVVVEDGAQYAPGEEPFS